MMICDQAKGDSISGVSLVPCSQPGWRCQVNSEGLCQAAFHQFELKKHCQLKISIGMIFKVSFLLQHLIKSRIEKDWAMGGWFFLLEVLGEFFFFLFQRVTPGHGCCLERCFRSFQPCRFCALVTATSQVEFQRRVLQLLSPSGWNQGFPCCCTMG